MKKQFLALFTALILLFPAAPAQAAGSTIAEGKYGPNLTWRFTDDGKLTVDGIGTMQEVYGEAAPWAQYAPQIREVSLPPGLNSISGLAFAGCTALQEIQIPSLVEKISVSAFDGCSSLVSISVSPENKHLRSVDGVLYDYGQTHLLRCPPGKAGVLSLPEGVERIGQHSFENCAALEEVVFPASVRQIDQAAFSGCTSLARAVLPEGLIQISDEAFLGCTSLTSFHIPAATDSLLVSAFDGCSSILEFTVSPGNTKFSAVDGVLFHSVYRALFRFPAAKAGEYTVPDGVEFIWSDAFSGSGAVTRVTLPESIREIGDRAFYGCAKLEEVVMNEGLSELGWQAFNECPSLLRLRLPATLSRATPRDRLYVSLCAGTPSLTAIEVAPGNKLFRAEDGVLFQGTTLIACPGGKAGAYAPEGGFTEVGDYAFWKCEKLTSVTLPEGVETIGFYAFQDCTALEELILPNSVRFLRTGYVDGCTSLQNLVLPDWRSWPDLSEQYGTEANNDLRYMPKLDGPFYVDGAVYEQEEGGIALCRYPEGYDSPFFRIPKGVTSIRPDAFQYGRRWMREIEFPEGITEISAPLGQCAMLTKVVLPSTLKKIGDHVFDECPALETVECPVSRMQFAEVSVGEGNEPLRKASWKYPMGIFVHKAVAEADGARLTVAVEPNGFHWAVFAAFDESGRLAGAKCIPVNQYFQEEVFVPTDGKPARVRAILLNREDIITTWLGGPGTDILLTDTEG